MATGEAGDDKGERQIVATEQDGKFVGAGAVGVSGVADIGKLGQSAKAIRFIAAGRDEFAGKPKAFL
jgi:hypothetical protein